MNRTINILLSIMLGLVMTVSFGANSSFVFAADNTEPETNIIEDVDSKTEQDAADGVNSEDIDDAEVRTDAEDQAGAADGIDTEIQAEDDDNKANVDKDNRTVEENESPAGLATDKAITASDEPTSKRFPASLNIKAEKTLVGADIDSDEYKNAFEFTIEASPAWAPLPDITTVNNNGSKIEFGTISFWDAGIYTYTIKEKIGDKEGLVYSEKEKKITVTVVEKPAGNDICLEIVDITSESGEEDISTAYEEDFPAATAIDRGIGYTYQNANGNFGSSFAIKDASSYYQDGDVYHAFCLEYSKANPTVSPLNPNGVEFTKQQIISPDTAQQLETLKKIAYFGYPNDGSGSLLNYAKSRNNSYLRNAGLSDEALFRYATNVAIWKTMDSAFTPPEKTSPL